MARLDSHKSEQEVQQYLSLGAGLPASKPADPALVVGVEAFVNTLWSSTCAHYTGHWVRISLVPPGTPAVAAEH